jgi:transcriptional regulator EpsA
MDYVSNEQAQAIVSAIEAAMRVRRRYQFFVWAQSHLKALVPHQVVVCGSYQRLRRDVVFEVFNTIPVAPLLLAALRDGSSALMQQVTLAWVDGRGRPLALDLAVLEGTAAGIERDRFAAAGFEELLVHGVSRPQRPGEIESLFILASCKDRSTSLQQTCFELMLPYLHSTWLRVQDTERELAAPASGTSAVPPPPDHARGIITDRERQILSWVREGKSNLQISVQLGISALTVKNHVQKILRKLGASNRAQAVAKAMTLQLLGRAVSDDGGSRCMGL